MKKIVERRPATGPGDLQAMWEGSMQLVCPTHPEEGQAIPGFGVMELLSYVWRLGPRCSGGCMLRVQVRGLAPACCLHMCF